MRGHYINPELAAEISRREAVKQANTEASASAPPPRAMAFDAGKLDLNLVPPEWIETSVGPFQAGVNKGYPRDNWKESLNTEEHDSFIARRLNSLQRHLLAHRKGELIDAETGIPHMELLAWNAKVIAWYNANDTRKAGA